MNFQKLVLGTTCIAIGATSVLQISAAYAADPSDFLSSPITSPITITTTPTPTVDVTPTPTTAPTNNGGGNSNNNSNNSNNNPGTQTYSCNDQKPTAVPRLIGAIPTGKDQITLFWTKVNGPVSNYQIAFGTKTGNMVYGLPKVGDANTTTISINSLNLNTKYYFKVKAVNGCMPGDFSNEVGATTTRNFKKLPTNFKPAVVTAKSVVQSIKKDKPQTPNRIIVKTQTTGNNIFQNIFKFFSGK